MSTRIRVNFAAALPRAQVEAAHKEAATDLEGRAELNIQAQTVEVGEDTVESVTRQIVFVAETEHAADGIAYAADLAVRLPDKVVASLDVAVV